MIDVEKALYEKKEELKMLKIPENMEQELRAALSKKSSRLTNSWIACGLILVLTFSYSFDSLAYYGKKFIGYDEIMNRSIKKLNEDGRGQEINKSCVFSDGVEVTLAGIMFDDEEIVAFVKIHSTKDKLSSNIPLCTLKGLKPLGYNRKSEQGVFNDEYTAVVKESFEAPEFYEKWMKLDVVYTNGQMSEVQSIPFTLKRNEAIKQEIKEDIYKQVLIGDYNIKFDYISASRISTRINGKIIPLNDNLDKGFNMNNNYGEFEGPNLLFDMVANGDKIIQTTGRRRSSRGQDSSFTNESEAIPKDLRTLELKNIRLEWLKYVDKEIDITLDTRNEVVADDLIIKKVELENDIMNLTISSRGIPMIGAFAEGSQLEQVNFNEFKYERRNDEMVDRVYKFKGIKKNMKLRVDWIRYSETSDKSVEIPVD